jgi:hypothetical protein
VFTVEFRDRVRERVLELASGDARVVAGAAVGSSVAGALDLACLQRDLPVSYGRGFDALPRKLLDESALVRSLDRDELLRALRAAVALLVRVDPERSAPLEERFRELVS